MSKRVMQTVNDSSGKSRRTMQSYQHAWMAHWMQTSSKATAERCDNDACGNKELDCIPTVDDLTDGLVASRSTRRPSMIETETESLKTSLKSLGNEGMHSSVMKYGQDTDDMQTIRPIINHNLERCKTIDWKGPLQFPSAVPAANETSLREYYSIDEGTSKNPLEWVKTHVSGKDRSSATSTSFLENYVGSSTHIVPYHNLGNNKFDKGKAVLCPPSIVFDNQYLNTKLRILEQEHCQNLSQSADLICERKVRSHSESGTSMNACFRACNTSSFLGAPSMDDRPLPTFGQDWFQKMQKCSGISLLPSQCNALEKNEPTISPYDHYSVQKLPNCVHDLETMRICTTADSVEAMAGVCPRFSQTTHSLLITKQTDVNASKENDYFRSLLAKMNGNSSSELHNVLPLFGQANRGVKLQSLSSSSNSEGQRNVGDIGIGTSKGAIKSESSAETSTMDIDFLKEEKLNSGANASGSMKGFNFNTSLSPRVDVDSSREIGCQRTGLPDIRLELPALPALPSSSENVCPSSSRTQSLEMDMLLVHAEQQPNPESILFLDNSSKADPTTRWIKRLKLISSESSAQGTKSSNLDENSSHDKKRGYRSKINSSITSSEPSPRKHHGRETMLLDRSRDLSKEDDHFMLNPAKKAKALLLSRAWIKRWLRNGPQISTEKQETLEASEPQSLKFAGENLTKKQFPSIVAMALMGKAMSGLESCELQNKGSFTVWNTKAF